MKKILTLAVLVCFVACTKEETTVQIIRKPVIKFSTAAFDWQADSYSFSDPVQVVEYPSGAGASGKLYTRYRLQATGRNSQGQQLQLILQFDTGESGRLTGTFAPSYTADRGLAGVQLYRLGDNLASYSLCTSDTANARLQVERQSQSERLISGTFHMTLCDQKDTSMKITITDGVINDVRY